MPGSSRLHKTNTLIYNIMLRIDIPGSPSLLLKHLVLDFNGTIAEDGELLSPVPEQINDLAAKLDIHIITADTHGTVQEQVSGLPSTLSVIPEDKQDVAKETLITRLGYENVVAIGNGKNDALMLKRAALGIGIIGHEGASSAMLLHADVICVNIVDCLSLLTKPNRLKATLRN